MIKLVIVNEALAQNLNIKKVKNNFKLIQTIFLKKRIRNKKLFTSIKEVTCVFLSSKEMKKINFQFRHKNYPTDVLSFNSDDPNSLGELLFCSDVLKSQAKDQGHSFELEFYYMLIHGLLHLLGYDHELSKKEEKLMFSLQDQCFQILNSN